MLVLNLITFFFCVYSSEEIQMDDFRQSRNASPASRNSSNVPSRSHTPSRLSTEPIVITPISITGATMSSASLSVANAVESVEHDLSSKETSFIAEKRVIGKIETV